MNNRISKLLNQPMSNKLVIPFFTAGFPTAKKTIDYIKAAIDSGVDMVEIGLPFSDPMADGPEIQYSSKYALDQEIDLKKIFQIVEKVRKYSSIPLILMGYYNPLLAMGENKFIKQANSAGADGLIIPDLSIEEADNFGQICLKTEMATIFLVSPTSTDKRIKMIDKKSSGFVYAVTVTGVTGVGKKFGIKTDRYLKNLKTTLKNKVVAGFGVASVESAKRLAKNTDGIVIGSKLVQIIRESKNHDLALRNLNKLLSSIRKAI